MRGRIHQWARVFFEKQKEYKHIHTHANNNNSHNSGTKNEDRKGHLKISF